MKPLPEKVLGKIAEGWEYKNQSEKVITLKRGHLRMTYFKETDTFSHEWTAPTVVKRKLMR